MILDALLLQGEHPFHVSAAARQFVQFLGWFGIFGALGFRFAVVPGADASLREPERELGAFDEIRVRALRGAALVGLAGALLLIAALLPANRRNTVSLACASVLLLAYAVARGGRDFAWIIALLAGLALVFQNAVSLRWATLINPIHMTCAALWIGTLFVVVAAGLPAVLRAPIGERRGPLVAELVARFSPLALVAAGLLVASGVVTAWRHLGSLQALWTTGYGIALLVKLLFVATVLALGAWNWRRLSPRLGTEEAAHRIRRSATAEVSVALIVLVVTAVLVSLPSPAERHRPPASGPGGPELVLPPRPGR
jgi:putative copper resistance protein D